MAQVTVTAVNDQEVGVGGFKRTKNEWYAFLPGCFSISMVVIGATGDCPGISGLRTFCIIAGACTIANAAIPFIFRTKKLKAEGREKELPPWLFHLATALGGFTLALAVWGAALAFPNGSYFSGPADVAAALSKYGVNATASQLDEYCGTSVYITGFVASLIPIVIVSICIIGCIVLFSVPDEKLPEAAKKMKASMMAKDKMPAVASATSAARPGADAYRSAAGAASSA